MKKHLLTIVMAMAITLSAFLPQQVNAQAPQAFKYQAVVRNADGNTLPNQDVNFRFTIHNDSANGTIIYSETNLTTTTDIGMAYLEVGRGNPVLGGFSDINWGLDEKYLEIEIDISGGTDFASLGASQMLSVPFALYANETKAKEITDDDNNTRITVEENPNDDTIRFYVAGNEVMKHDGQTLHFTGEEKNIFIGKNAGVSNTTGNNSIAVGNYSLYSCTDRSGLVAIGDSALFNNGVGAIGIWDAVGNTAIGSNTLQNNSRGSINTAIGQYAMYSNTSGDYNTAIGYAVMESNTTGFENTAIGYQSLANNTYGRYNTAIGAQALAWNSSGMNNVAIGYQADHYNETGYNNTIIGSRTGPSYPLHSKSGNVFIGYMAGSHEFGDNKLYIENSGAAADTAFIYGEFDNEILAFNADVGIGTISPTAKLDVNGQTRIRSLPTDNTLDSIVVADGNGVLYYRTFSTMGDNLGNHTATQNIDLNGNLLTGDGGIDLGDATDDGIKVYNAGNPSTHQNSTHKNGFEVAGAEGYGLFVGRSDNDGVHIYDAGDDGVIVESANDNLFQGGNNGSEVFTVSNTGNVTANSFTGDGSGLTGLSGDNLGNHTATQNIQTNGNWISSDGGDEGLFVLSDGRVGVRIDDPNESLEIGGTGRMFIGDGGGSNRTGLLIDANESGNNIRFQGFDYGTSSDMNLLLNPGGGNIGIGTTSPGAPLEVNDQSDLPTLILGRATGMASIKSSDTYLMLESNGEKIGLNWYNDDDVILANGGGNVGIGTPSPTNPLYVKAAGTNSGGNASYNEVVSRFRNTNQGNNSAISIDAGNGQDPIIYLSENNNVKWGIRSDVSDYYDNFEIRDHRNNENHTIFELEYWPVWDDYFATFHGHVIPSLDEAYNSGNLGEAWYNVHSYDFVEVTKNDGSKQQLNTGLSELMELHTISYTNNKSGNSYPKTGIDLDQLTSLIPSAVVVPEKGQENYGIKYNQLIPVLIKSIQEQQQEIQNQKTEIEQLKASIEEIRKLIK